jgi:predicted ATPase
MRVRHLTIVNYRGIESLSLPLTGEDAVFIGPNGGGKTAVLTAIAKAIGLDRAMTVEDFTESSLPVELTCVLDDLPAEAVGDFAGELTYGATTTLTVGMRATMESGEIEVVSGFPDAGWRRVSRAQMSSLPAVWLPSWRDPTRLLALTGNRSLLARLLRALPLDRELDQATNDVAAAAAFLASASPLVQLLADASGRLRELVPGIPPDALSVGQSSQVELLRVLALRLLTTGPPIDIPRQSSGLAQLSILAIAIHTLTLAPSAVVLVDEPEISLHPHAQRAVLAALRSHAGQSLIATHSAAALDRMDPRAIHRLSRVGSAVTARVPAVSDEREARRIMRYADPRVSEAFFATTVLLVEGPSDRLAILALATKQGRDLDAEGISVTALDGAGTFGTMLGLLGPKGLGIRIIGLCDADAEQRWARVLAEGGAVPDRAAMAAQGFLVADPGLEALLVGALGEVDVEAVITQEGSQRQFEMFARQPQQQGQSKRDQLINFIQKDKTRWAPLLAEALELQSIPAALAEVLAHA